MFWSWELVRCGYGPSHTWEGYRGNGGCSSTAGVASALCQQSKRLQGVFSRVDLRFLYGRTQFGGGEGVSARKKERNKPKFNQPATGPEAPGDIAEERRHMSENCSSGVNTAGVVGTVEVRYTQSTSRDNSSSSYNTHIQCLCVMLSDYTIVHPLGGAWNVAFCCYTTEEESPRSYDL